MLAIVITLKPAEQDTNRANSTKVSPVRYSLVICLIYRELWLLPNQILFRKTLLTVILAKFVLLSSKETLD